MQTADGPGTYVIRCLANGKVYVGSSSVSVGKRQYSHFCSLRRGSHYSRMLQEDFQKFGEGSFVFEFVESMSSEMTIDAEKRLIETLDATNPEIGYNINKAPHANAGRPKQAAKLKALVMTVSIKPEHKRKIERIMKAHNLDRSKAVQWLIDRAEG
jgi:group I intron endonuclease